MIGTRQPADHEIGAGGTARADRVLAEAGIENPAAELVLLHSEEPGGWRGGAEELSTRLGAAAGVARIEDPISSADGRDGLVRFDLAGPYDTAVSTAAPVLADEVIGKDFTQAEWTAVPLALGLLVFISHVIAVDSSTASVMLPMGLTVGWTTRCSICGASGRNGPRGVIGRALWLWPPRPRVTRSWSPASR